MLFARSNNDKNTLFNMKYRVAVIKCFIVIQRIFRIVASYAIIAACCRFCFLPMPTFNIITTFISFHSTLFQPTSNTIQLPFFHRVETLCVFEIPWKIHFPNANLGFCDLHGMDFLCILYYSDIKRIKWNTKIALLSLIASNSLKQWLIQQSA